MATFRSIQMKMFAGVFGLIFVVVASLAIYFPNYHVASVRHRLEQKAAAYGHLISREVESAIAFDDRQTAREVFDALEGDGDIRAVALYAASGRALLVHGELANPEPPAAPATHLTTEVLETSIRCIVPVVSKEGPRGTLVLEVSTKSVDDERTAIVSVAIVVGLVALAAGLLSSWLLARSIGRRLRAIASVTARVAEGDLDQAAIKDDSLDEIGQLARSFNGMVGKLRQLVQDMSTMAATEKSRLDHLVQERTDELASRNADIRLVLDHVGEGFLTLNIDGTVSREKSAIVTTWLGPMPDGTVFSTYLSALDPHFGACFGLGLEGILEDVLPIEVAVDQMPTLLCLGSQRLRLRYSPILLDGHLSRLLIVISDVTSELERERAEAFQRELLSLVSRLIADRAGVMEFMSDGEEIIAQVRAHDTERFQLMQAVHTLKGNCGLYGLTRLAERCHELESLVADRIGVPTDQERTPVLEAWNDVGRIVRSLTGDQAQGTLELSIEDLAMLRRSLTEGRSHADVLAQLTELELEPVERRFARLAEQARAIAARLDKLEPSIVVDPNGVRLDGQRWAPIWATFTHVIRNAIDHGIEPQHERVRAGKPPAGVLTLRATRGAGCVMIDLCDDGAGIDWNRLAQQAKQAGLKTSSRAELEAALFVDGISTKDAVTEISGRGVGLSAVKATCAQFGAELRVHSTLGRGTTVSVRFPTTNVSPRPGRSFDKTVVNARGT